MTTSATRPAAVGGTRSPDHGTPRHRPDANRPDATGPNAIGAALGLLGDEWRLLVVRTAFEGARRYGDWKERLAVSDAVLSARLRSLVDAGVLQRRPSHTGGHHEYVLTTSGRELWVLLLGIWDWERRHVAGQADRLPDMVHATCGRPFHPELACGDCRALIDVGDVTAAFGPSGGFARSVPVGTHRRRSHRRDPAHVDRDAGLDGGPGLVAETMAIIGNRWSAAIVGAAMLGANRFVDLERALGVPPTILAERLRSFVALGVLATTGDRGEYRLTAKGEALFPIVVALVSWGERWMPALDGPAVVANHTGCGAALLPVWTCSACGDDLRRADVRIVPRRTDHLAPGRTAATVTPG